MLRRAFLCGVELQFGCEIWLAKKMSRYAYLAEK